MNNNSQKSKQPVVVNDVHGIASNLEEFIGFMATCYRNNVHLIINGKSEWDVIDTSTAMGQVMVQTCYALDKFANEEFR